MKNQWLTIRQLDTQLKEWQAIGKKYSRPRAGWIKTLRVALSMSAEQFAERLGLTRGRVNQLENSEIHDAITLRTLREAANALGCEVIYAIVPKGNSTLENIIKIKAEQVAKERIESVAHSMSLEAQTVDSNNLKIQKDELAKNLAENLNKKFWTLPDQFSSLAEAIYIQMVKNEEIPTQKAWRKAFINKIDDYIFKVQNEPTTYEYDLLNKLKNPEFVNALKNALVRHHLTQTKKTKQSDLLQQLIDNLKKKK